MSFLDTKHKKKSFTLTSVLLSLLILLLFYVGLTYLDPPPESGISVNFGTTNFGSGKVQPKEKIKSEPVNKPIIEESQEEEKVQPEKVEPEPEPEKSVEEAEEVVTQENEESIRINKQKEAKRKADELAKQKADEARKEKERIKAEAERVERERKEAEDKIKKEQEDKKKKLDQLMGGLNKSDGSTSGGEGDDNRAGDKGQPDGDPYASSYYGSPGSGSGGIGYGLKGRSLVSKGKVQQDCNEEGKVVVKIIVDQSGKVISATPGVRGSTNTSPCLLIPAKKTALMHKWNLDSNAPLRQIGFVVVNFKLGE